MRWLRLQYDAPKYERFSSLPSWIAAAATGRAFVSLVSKVRGPTSPKTLEQVPQDAHRPMLLGFPFSNSLPKLF